MGNLSKKAASQKSPKMFTWVNFAFSRKYSNFESRVARRGGMWTSMVNIRAGIEIIAAISPKIAQCDFTRCPLSAMIQYFLRWYSATMFEINIRWSYRNKIGLTDSLRIERPVGVLDEWWYRWKIFSWRTFSQTYWIYIRYTRLSNERLVN